MIELLKKYVPQQIFIDHIDIKSNDWLMGMYIFMKAMGKKYEYHYFNSEPNEPTVLECKDKMINEI